MIYRVFTAIVPALETYEFSIIGSEPPITSFTDHKPSPTLPRNAFYIHNRHFIRHQIVFTRSPKLVNFWTRGQKLCLVDLLTRHFLTKFPKCPQKLQQTTPQSIEFHTATSKDLINVNQTQYVINDEPTPLRAQKTFIQSIVKMAKIT